MLVYIDENYSEAKAKSVGSQINLITNVRSATFVSRDQALDDFVETLNDAGCCLQASTPIRCATAIVVTARGQLLL